MEQHDSIIDLNGIFQGLETHDGLPRPNWAVVYDWIESHVSDERLDAVWTQLARDWIGLLSSALACNYALTESSNFLLLSSRDQESAKRMLAWCEHSRRTILETLAGVTRSEGYGKHVVLDFGDADVYYDYISYFYPEEGDFGLTGGMFLGEGYGHIAICTAGRNEYEWVIAHELSHNLLRHLPLPLWLDEGVTQVMEATVVGRSSFTVNREVVAQHRAYWNADTIQDFWTGRSFYFSDDGQELSYHLAETLFRNLAADYAKKLAVFLNAANDADAGDEALQNACGVSLQNCLTQFLGEGNWAPRPSDWNLVPPPNDA